MNQLVNIQNVINHYRVGINSSLKNNDIQSAYDLTTSMIDCLPKGYKSKLHGKLSKKTLKDLIRRNERNIARLTKKYSKNMRLSSHE